MHTQARKKQTKHSKTALLAGKKWWWWFWRFVVPIKIDFALVFLRSIVICLGSLANWSSRISPLGVVVGWERGGFQPKVFGAKKKSSQTTKKREGKVPSKRGLASEGDIFVDLWRNLLPKSYQNAGSPCPTLTFSATFRRMRFGKKMVSSPSKKWAFWGPWPQGNGLGSISCGDYDFQEGVLSSRCFGWTPGPFHQRRKYNSGGVDFSGMGMWRKMWRKKCCKSPKVGWSLIVSALNFLGMANWICDGSWFE